MVEDILATASSPVTLAGLEFLPVISYGHVITFALTIIGAFIAFGKIIGLVLSTRKDVEDLRKDVRELRRGISELTTALLTFKTSGTLHGRQDDDFSPSE